MKHGEITYKEFLDLLGERKINNHPRKPGVFLRHDVDNFIEKSYQMALYEEKRGISSCYFLLHPIGNEKTYWNNKETWVMAKEMQDMGHVIGFHNSIIIDAILTKKQPEDLLLIYLEKMRKYDLKIIGTCEHGHPLCYEYKVRNRQIWDLYTPTKIFSQYNLQDFGLLWDCSYINALKKSEEYGLEKDNPHDELFLMDAGKKHNWWFGNTLEQIKKSPVNKKIHINIHPERWIK